MRKIAIVGFKGGIGKTTTCVNLGAALALRGHRVLLIDTDTQANLAIALGVRKYEKSLADVLIRKAKAEECIVPARHNLDLLPSSISLFKAQQRMVLEMAREEIFAELFVGLNNYDYLLLDCAPSVSLLT
ncbi:MAG TPA: AAA family ATPase, partial [Anaerolineae bacterium]|nr:AAA family ATPase [Anaerolineae bacterium]